MTPKPSLPGSMTSKIRTSKSGSLVELFERGFTGIDRFDLIAFGFKIEA